jgi:hypothetical protein
VFPSLGNILRADVDDGTSDTFGRGDDDVVVLGDLEGVEFAFRGRLVEDSVVDRIRDRVVDEFTQNQTICERDVETVSLQEIGHGHGSFRADLGIRRTVACSRSGSGAGDRHRRRQKEPARRIAIHIVRAVHKHSILSALWYSQH